MTAPAPGRALRWALLLAAALPSTATATAPCPSAIRGDSARAWAPPLDRPVTIEADRISLRDGLDRLAASAGFRLSYSGDHLPLDRQVCLSVRAEPAGVALLHLLAGTGVEPLIVGPAQVVLPPPAQPEPAPLAAPVELATIVVTGSPAGQARRELPLALDVVRGEDLRQRGDGGLAAALSGAVPGLWLWAQAPTSVLASYASIRGASSFGLSYPKVYIDGIELANPLLLTGLAPEAVDRVEVIRGPQGAALYGADAISGVMNVVTRQEGADPAAPRFTARSDVSLTGTDYAGGAVVGQRHALGARLGSQLTSGAVHLAGGTEGAYIPGAARQFLSGHGTLRHVAERWMLTGLGRFSTEVADAPPSPLLPDSSVRPRRGLAGGTSQSVLTYTLGSNLRILPGERWSHSVVAGLDGYRLEGVADERTPITSATDSALRAAVGGAVRGTLRLGTVRHQPLGGASWSDLALSAEHSILRQWASIDSGPRDNRASGSTRHTSGASLTGSAGLAERLFLSGGLRVEGTTGNDPVLIPMAGAAWVVGGSSVSLKLRAAYGKGVRWPTGAVRTAFSGGPQATRSAAGLDPEEQSGLEAGADLAVERTVTLSVTRFDQVASGLIQRVGVALDTSGGPGQPRVTYALENVGEITNHGWEAAVSVRGGPAVLRGAWSEVDSRVRRLAPRYGGDLLPGDRMLEVPRHTLSLTATVRQSGWLATGTVARASDWINYDRLQIAQDFAAGQPARNFVGQRLRSYWRTYPGVTRLRLSVSRDLGSHLGLTVTGDNLLDAQRGEPDNLTIVPGRSVGLALRAAW
ncbi:MAG: TonB-dependent receptor [Gemmatimonadetes bacterium]|nr:TonB-dependent receptor [Gemmatimonadota bacterium]